MEGGDDRKIKHHETGSASVEKEILHIDRQTTARHYGQPERDQQVDKNQASGNNPGFHHTAT